MAAARQTPASRARIGASEGAFRALPRWPFVVCASLALGACSVTDAISEKGRIDYKSASTNRSANLEVPPDLINPRGNERFNVPERAQRERTFSGYQTARSVEPAVSEQKVLPAPKGMRIERQGAQRWLVVDQSAERLWPQLVEFWEQSGFVVSINQPAIGLMETDWAENRAKIPQDLLRRTLGRVFDTLYSSSERDKFRVRLEPTAGGGTELYLTHRGMSEEWTSPTKENTVWKPRPSDPELENEFLRRIMVKLGSTPENAAQTVASGQKPAEGEGVRIVTAGATSLVEIAEGFDRSWRRVGLALDRGGFTVEDRDRSKGLYFVRYVDPEVEGSAGGKPGFFGRLLTSQKKATSAQQYRIQVEGTDERTRVGVLGKDGAPLSSEFDRKTADKILKLLREQLLQ
ncbi:MAG: hypothetical protein RIS35_673 [Pseudomonadota bacterium]